MWHKMLLFCPILFMTDLFSFFKLIFFECELTLCDSACDNSTATPTAIAYYYKNKSATKCHFQWGLNLEPLSF